MEKKKSIFRQESLDRVESPEQLDQYIRVSTPSAWIMVSALLIASASLLIWSFTGSLPQTITVKGITSGEGEVYCYMNPSDVQESMVGCQVQMTLPDNSTMQGTVSEISSVPYSLEEVSEILEKDWIIDQLIDSDYVYQLKVDAETETGQDVIVQASIVTSEVKPITYVLN